MQDSACVVRGRGALNSLLAALVFFMAGWSVPKSQGQCQPGWLTGTNAPALDGGISSMLELPNGEVMVVGNFSAIGGIAARNAAIYSPANRTWRAAGQGVGLVYPGLPYPSSYLRLEPGGTVLLAARQLNDSGYLRFLIHRFDPITGAWTPISSDLNFDGASPMLNGCLALPNGDIWIAGSLRRISSPQTPVSVARYVASTGMWTYWSVPVISRLLRTTSGEIFGTSSGVLRFDPAANAWVQLNVNLRGAGFYDAVALPDGDIAVCGTSFTVNNVAISRVGRYTPATNTWSQLGSPVTSDSVHDLVVSPRGELIATGAFTRIGGVSATHIAAFNFGTNTWRALGLQSVYAPNAIIGLQDGSALAYGNFETSVSTQFQTAPSEVASLRRYVPTSNTWQANSAGAYSEGVISDGLALPNGEAIVIGNFTALEGTPVRGIARYVPGPNQTHSWSSVADIDGSVNTIIQDSPTTAIIGGYFTRVGSVAASRIARINLQSGQAEPLGLGTSGTVNSVAKLPSGVLFVTGYFSTAGGMPAASIAFYDPATQRWSVPSSGLAFTGGSLGYGYDAKVFPDGSLVLGGSFDTVAGVMAKGFVRYSPAAGSWSPLGSNAGISRVSKFYPLPNGDALAYAQISLDGGTAVSDIYRYTASTDIWTQSGSEFAHVTLRPLQDGTFLRSGRSQLYKYDPAAETSTLIGTASPESTSLSPTILGGVELANHDIIISGYFNKMDGSFASNVAIYAAAPASAAIIGASPDLTLCEGTFGALQVSVSGTGPFTYAWRHDGAPIDVTDNPTANSAGLAFADVNASEGGVYDCVVSNACGSSQPHFFQVTVLPADHPGCPGQTCDPDVNQDGNVDAGDLDYLVNVISGGENPTQIDPDFNYDGVTDQGDIDAILTTISGGGCP